MVKNLPANAGDISDAISIPGSRRSPGVESGNPLHYSYLENPMDREAWGLQGFARVGHNWACSILEWKDDGKLEFFFSLLLKDKLSCIKSFKSLLKQKLIQTRQHPGQWRLEEPAIWNERFSRQKRARGRSYPGQESRLWVPSGNGEDCGAGDWWGFIPGKAEPIIRSWFGRGA